MATPAELQRARNAALRLAHSVQPYAQVDLPLAAGTDIVRAGLKDAADEAIMAAIDIGGEGPGPEPMPQTRAMIDHMDFTQVLDYRGVNAYQAIGNLIVEDNALLAVTLPANHTVLKSGARLQLNNVQYTFTIVNGQVTAIQAVPF